MIFIPWVLGPLTQQVTGLQLPGDIRGPTSSMHLPFIDHMCPLIMKVASKKSLTLALLAAVELAA